MAQKNFCSPENISVIIPYKDFAKLMEIPTLFDQMQKDMKRMEERNAAMQLMYSEMLEKIGEINRYL